MNARLYDPVLGRFVSPDPYVADPTSAQAFNRYMYVGNNPLMFTDPTGERRRLLENVYGEEPMPEGALESRNCGIHFYQYQRPESYFYDNGRYYYGDRYNRSNAEEVEWNEVYNNYISPNISDFKEDDNNHIYRQSNASEGIETTYMVTGIKLNGTSFEFQTTVSYNGGNSYLAALGALADNDFGSDLNEGGFPLEKRVDSYLKYPARFGDTRSNESRKHAGCDLYATPGTNVYAVKAGIVTMNPYKFYRGSSAVEINHGNFIARYCEINIINGLHEGSRVSKGQLIGTVADLSLSNSMLHFDMYSGDAHGPLTNKANHPYMRRGDLINPTHFLNYGY